MINKVLWMTDIHMKHSNLTLTKQLFDFVLKQLKEQGVKSLVISGDVQDSKAIMRAECVSQLRWFCWQCTSNKVDVYVLVGNHDMVNSKDMKFGHSLEFLKDIDGVRVIDTPQVQEIGDYQVKFIPYMDDQKLLLKELKKKDAEFLFCHNGISGAMMNAKGFKDDFSISPERYKNFKGVFVGHYHNSQKLENIIYLGSPFSHSFAEANVKKYIGIIDLPSGKIELVTPGLRQHYDSIFKSKDVLSGKIDVSKSVFNKGDLVRMFLHGTKEDNKKVTGMMFEHDNMKIIFKNEDRTKERIKINPGEARLDIVQKYIDKVNTTLNKGKLFIIAKKMV